MFILRNIHISNPRQSRVLVVVIIVVRRVVEVEKCGSLLNICIIIFMIYIDFLKSE